MPGTGPAGRLVRSCRENPRVSSRYWIGPQAASTTLLQRLLELTPLLFAQSLPRKSFFGPALFSGLHVITMLLNLLDDVFLLHLALKAAQRILQGFAFLNRDFCQVILTPIRIRSVRSIP